MNKLFENRIVGYGCLHCNLVVSYYKKKTNRPRSLMVFTYDDQLEDTRVSDNCDNFVSFLHKTKRFQVAMRLFSNISRKRQKSGRNIGESYCVPRFCS